MSRALTGTTRCSLVLQEVLCPGFYNLAVDTDNFAVWSTLLAGANKLQDDPGSIPVSFIFRQTLLCFLYCWILCGAGMVWNDWVDRDIDAEVERTKSRPLASGRLSTTVALSWMMAQFLSSVVILAYMLDGQDMYVYCIPSIPAEKTHPCD